MATVQSLPSTFGIIQGLARGIPAPTTQQVIQAAARGVDTSKLGYSSGGAASFGGSYSSSVSGLGVSYVSPQQAFFGGVSSGQIRDPVTGNVYNRGDSEGQKVMQQFVAAEEARAVAQRAVKAAEASKDLAQPVALLAVDLGVKGSQVYSVQKPVPVRQGPSAFSASSAPVAVRSLSGINAASSRLEAERKEIVRLRASQVSPTPALNRRIEVYNRDAARLGNEVDVYNMQQSLKAVSTWAPLYTIEPAPQKGYAKQVFDRPGFGKAKESPLMLGLEAEQARLVSKELVSRVPSTRLAKEYSEARKELDFFEEKRGFSTKGELGFFGLSEKEEGRARIAEETLLGFETTGKKRIRLLAETADYPGAFFETAGLIGRKGVEIAIPKEKQFSPGLGLLPKEITPVVSPIRSFFGLTTTEAQYSLFGGTRQEMIAKGGLAGTTLAQWALFTAVTSPSAKTTVKKVGELQAEGLGEFGAIGKGRKKLELPKIPELGGYIEKAPGRFTQPRGFEEDIMLGVKSGGIPDLSKFVQKPKGTFTPGRTLQEDIMFGVKSGGIPDSSKFVKVVGKKGKGFFEPLIPQKGPDLTRFLEPSRGLQYEEVMFRKAVGLPVKKVEGIYFEKTLTPFKFKTPKTTAGLVKSKQMTLEKFAKEISIIAEGKMVRQKSFVPGSYAALSQTLGRTSEKGWDLGVGTRESFLEKQPKSAFPEFEKQTVRPLFEKIGAMRAPLLGSFLGTTPFQGLPEREKRKERVSSLSKSLITEMGGQVEAQPTREKTRTAFSSLVVEASVMQPLFREAQRTAQRQQQVQRTQQRVLVRIPSQRMTQFFPHPEITLPKIKVPPPPILFSQKGFSRGSLKTMVQGFAVFAKRRGKIFRLTPGSFTRLAALSKGAKWADIGAGASFYVKPVKGPVKVSPEKDWLSLGSRFYKSKKGAYVERTRFRISTPGEKQEITFAPRRSKALKALKTFNFRGGLARV